MISSQKKDAVFSFNLQYFILLYFHYHVYMNFLYYSYDPLLSVKVDNQWRKDFLKGK